MKIGAFTIGGGYAMIPIIENEVVKKNNWISEEDFLDMVVLAQTAPGILAMNISILVGNRVAGKSGAAVSALGAGLPSFVIILLIAMFLTPDTIKGNDTLRRIFMGIRPAVVALIVSPVLNAARNAKINAKTVIIPIAVALSIYSGIPYISNPILYIIIGAVGGIFLYHRRITEKSIK